MAVWSGHDLADRSSVSLEDFADRVFIDPGPRVPEYWAQSMLPQHTPSGRRVPRGPLIGTFHMVLSRIAARECLAPLNEHVPHYYSTPGVAFVPVHDAPITEWVLVWRKDVLHPRGRGFVDVVTELGPREFGTVRQ
ncbi:hypothetical protein FXN61_16765 [Lentzea sp. PSKA42]|uniref:LysR substrate-binding domain-containing protein n=1 Tax=Lentzea indica TaxID=2604800 RepID=A0ABX1FHE4_9PSEU|nr:hypothetical protein [Lentzea indica]